MTDDPKMSRVDPVEASAFIPHLSHEALAKWEPSAFSVTMVKNVKRKSGKQ
jgi:hypothetical protein